jgi:transcription antitermination factor NusG
VISVGNSANRTEISDLSRAGEEAFPHWYAIYTMPRHEKSVARYFGLKEIECFLPTYEKLRKWKNRQRVRIVLALFPRYVFARVNRMQRSVVLQTPGVLQFVGAGATPTPLRDVEIAFLRDETAKKAAEPFADLVIGSRVSIKRGPMAGIEGVLVHKQNGDRFIFTLHLIQKSISIQVAAEDLDTLPTVVMP